jgi:predicted kinase
MRRIVIISGPPGAGKSTVARRLSQAADGPLAMHVHTDDIYAYVTRGFVEPWRRESHDQNATLMNAMAAQAAVCATAGYEVFVDGIVGAWFLDPWLAVARAHGLDLRYVVVLPDLPTAIARATARTAPGAMTDATVVEQMWRVFEGQAVDPGHVVDTTGQGPHETVTAVRQGLAAGRFRLTLNSQPTP